MIHARNYLASTELGRENLMQGGHVDVPKIDLAKYYMVGGEVVRDEVLGNALEGRSLKDMSDELMLEFETCEKLGASKTRAFMKGLDTTGQTLLQFLVPADKFISYGITGLKLAKNTKLAQTLFPKFVNESKVFPIKPTSSLVKYSNSKPTELVATYKGEKWVIADRVIKESLKKTEYGQLNGKLTPNKVLEIAHSKNAKAYYSYQAKKVVEEIKGIKNEVSVIDYDRKMSVNIFKEIKGLPKGKILRITIDPSSKRIYSVGTVRRSYLTNGIGKGRFNLIESK